MKKLIFLFALLFACTCYGQKVLTYGGKVLTYDSKVLTVPSEPDDIAGLEFWYDGNDATTLSLNGNKVIQWDDKSGNTRHVSNAVDATRPTYDPVTGRVTFTAANSTYLQSAAFALTQPNTIFVVYKLTGPLNVNGAIFSGGVSNITRNQIYITLSDFRIFSGVELGATTTDANDNIHVGEFNGATSKYWINGGLEASGNAGTQPLNGITLGAGYNGTSDNIDAELMEAFGYNKVLTNAERISLENYLTAKWGL